MEKWLFRLLVLGLLGALVVATLGSTDDIKRYIRMKRM